MMRVTASQASCRNACVFMGKWFIRKYVVLDYSEIKEVQQAGFSEA